MCSGGKSAPAHSCMPVPPPPRLCIGSTGWHMQMPAVHVRLDTWCTAQSPPAHTSRHGRTSATTEAVQERSQHRTLVFWGASTGLLCALATQWESPDLTMGVTMLLARWAVPHIHPNAAQAIEYIANPMDLPTPCLWAPRGDLPGKAATSLALRLLLNLGYR